MIFKLILLLRFLFLHWEKDWNEEIKEKTKQKNGFHFVCRARQYKNFLKPCAHRGSECIIFVLLFIFFFLFVLFTIFVYSFQTNARPYERSSFSSSFLILVSSCCFLSLEQKIWKQKKKAKEEVTNDTHYTWHRISLTLTESLWMRWTRPLHIIDCHILCICVSGISMESWSANAYRMRERDKRDREKEMINAFTKHRSHRFWR